MPLVTSHQMDALAELGRIYDDLAHGPYGLTLLNQRAHAVQAGALAQQQGLGAELTVAALLHDVGHMVHDLGAHPAAEGIDDRHEQVGADWLARWFGPGVVEPVRLHVAAKRYLCAREAGYLARLSDDSIESLALQGGPMSEEEAAAFERTMHWQEAVTLRRIDELAKDPAGACPDFSDFTALLVAAMRAADPQDTGTA